MDIKIEIKEEFPFSEITSQTENESFSQGITVKLNSDGVVWNSDYEMEIKTEIKEEAVVSVFAQQNVKQYHNSYEMETKTGINDETVISDFCPQNKRHSFSEDCIMEVKNCNKECVVDTKIETQEEQWWLERIWWLERTSTEAPCFGAAMKDGLDKSFPSAESVRLCTGEVSRGKSVLFSGEDLGKSTRLNIRQGSPECQAARKYKSKVSDVAEISSVKRRVYAEQHDDEEMDSTSSCLKENCCYKSVLVTDNLICDNCDKRFTTQSYLKRHKLLCGYKKLHKCDICGKDFTQTSNLKKHKMIHEGKRPYKCDICGKDFNQLSSLKIHKLYHEGIKPHKCDICEKGFTQKSNLKTHKLIHEGKKPYSCDACGKCFITSYKLKLHKLIHVCKEPNK